MAGKFVNPNFPQYQSDRNNNKFNCFLEIQSKTTSKISICTLNPLKLSPNQIIKFIFDVNFPSWPGNSVNPFLPNIYLTKTIKNYLLFQKFLKNGFNNLYFDPYTFNMIYKSFSYLTSLSRRGPVNPSTSTFGSINLAKTMTNLLVVWKIDKKWQQ